MKSNQDPAEIISQHLSAAQDIGDRLTSSVMAQDDLLKEILIGNENFIKARKSDPITVKRDTMVRTLQDRLIHTYHTLVCVIMTCFVLSVVIHRFRLLHSSRKYYVYDF